MFIVFIVVCLIGIALLIAGAVSLRKTPNPLAYVAVVGGVVLGGVGLLFLMMTVL